MFISKPEPVNLYCQIQICPVSFLLHPAAGNEAEGSAVDAVAQSAGPGRTVFKHMAQVGITHAAAHLHAVHAMTAVRKLRDGAGHDRLCKAGPSAAGIKFVGRGKKRLSCNDIHI